MGYRRLADTDAFQRVHYEAKVNVIERQLEAIQRVNGDAFNWPPKREMAPWLRMRAEMATARREIL